MSLNAIITARWNSTRLSGKVLADIGGKPCLRWIVDSLKKSTTVKDIIVATSSSEIASYCNENNINFVMGPEHDVLARLRMAIKDFPCNHVLRLWGDNPFPNISLVDRVAGEFKKDMTYILKGGWSFYIFDTKSFLYMENEMSDIERYHWNLIEEISCWQTHGFKTNEYNTLIESANYSLDTPEDLKRLNEICKSTMSR